MKKGNKSAVKVYKYLKVINIWELKFSKNSLFVLILGNEDVNYI